MSDKDTKHLPNNAVEPSPEQKESLATRIPALSPIKSLRPGGIETPGIKSFRPVALSQVQRPMSVSVSKQDLLQQTKQATSNIVSVEKIQTPELVKQAPLQLSPSRIAEFFMNRCERALRYQATPKERRLSEGVPTLEGLPSEGIASSQLREEGEHWEEKVVAKLGSQVRVSTRNAEKLNEVRFSLSETVALLRTTPAGTWLYQLSLRVGELFYKAHEIDKTLFVLRDNFPDLVKITSSATGKRRLVVVDIKRSETVRTTHQVQIYLYALQLSYLVKEYGIEDLEIELDEGCIWLAGAEEPTVCDLKGIAPAVQRFLRYRAPQIFQKTLGQCAWHVTTSCEQCVYLQHCSKEMRDKNDLSRLTGLTARGKEFLQQQVGASDLRSLERWLNTTPNVDVILQRCASLSAGRTPLLRKIQSLLQNRVLLCGNAATLLPRFSTRELSLVLCLQEEPVDKSIYFAGFLLSRNHKEVSLDFLPGDPVQKQSGHVLHCFLAETRDEAKTLRARFLRTLHTLLRAIHDENDTISQKKSKYSLQCYTLTSIERDRFFSWLIEALLSGEEPEIVLDLVIYFCSPESIRSEAQPHEPVHFPLISLQQGLQEVLALPVEVNYSLVQSLQALNLYVDGQLKSATYQYRSGIRPDEVWKLWQGQAKGSVQKLLLVGKHYLKGLQSLLEKLREKQNEEAFARWSKEFSFPKSSTLQSPTLARLAFLAQYESILGCYDKRSVRLPLLDTQIARGEVSQLRYEDGYRFAVEAEALKNPLEESDFENWLLVVDTPEGRKEQLLYDDYSFGARSFSSKADESEWLVKKVRIKQVIRDEEKRPLQVVFAQFSQLLTTEKYLLYPRFSDGLRKKLLGFYDRLDAASSHLFFDLLRAPHNIPRRPIPYVVEGDIKHLLLTAGFTESQQEAFRRLRERRAMLLWGPPGTGKTFFLANMVVLLAKAHAAHNLPFRVLISAHTHAAIEHFLKKVAEAAKQIRFPGLDGLAVGKADLQLETTGVQAINKKRSEMAKFVNEHSWVVFGATPHRFYEEEVPSTFQFDLVIVDEASQLRVLEAPLLCNLVHPDGRILFSGDDQQLPPVIRGEYPSEEREALQAASKSSPLLHRSIFEAVRLAGQDDPTLVAQLEETFRMNDVLTNYAADLIYGSSYRCANEKVASQRMQLLPREAPAWLSFALEPKFPLVFAMLQNVQASQENPEEAALVAELVAHLRDTLLHKQNLFASDELFFKDGLFVVCPHRVQIRAVQQALAKRRQWESVPFVDTVDKMQGQEAEAVVVSYGVSDQEFALQESTFIYSRNRLNVAVTRAKSKSILFLPEPLVEGVPQVFEQPLAAEGLSYMQRMLRMAEATGESQIFTLEGGILLRVVRSAGTAVRLS